MTIVGGDYNAEVLAGRPSHHRLAKFGLRCFGLFAFWLVLSGRTEPKYVIVGLLSAALVTIATIDLSLSQTQFAPRTAGLRFLLHTSWRFLRYLPWLLYSIVQANIQVLSVVVHPQLPIDPRLLRFRTQHQSGISQVLLANSITLTPGTITVDVIDGEYVVHAIMPASASSLLTAEMQNKVAAVFGERPEQAPEASWTPRLVEGAS